MGEVLREGVVREVVVKDGVVRKVVLRKGVNCTSKGSGW